MKKMMLTMGIAIVIIVTLIAGCSTANNAEPKVEEMHSYQEIAEAYSIAEGHDFTEVKIKEVWTDDDGDEWMWFDVYNGEKLAYGHWVDVSYAENRAF